MLFNCYLGNNTVGSVYSWKTTNENKVKELVRGMLPEDLEAGNEDADSKMLRGLCSPAPLGRQPADKTLL